MSTTNLKTVDTWDLADFLAALRQVAQDANAAGRAPEMAAEDGPTSPGNLLLGDR